MSPKVIRDLDAEGAAIQRMIDDMPRGREHDMTGHLDAKREISIRLAKLRKRWREEAACRAIPEPARA